MALMVDGEREVSAEKSCPPFEMGFCTGCCLFIYLRRTQKLLQRGDADRAVVTHTEQLLEIVLLWCFSTLSSKVLIFKSHLCFCYGK